MAEVWVRLPLGALGSPAFLCCWLIRDLCLWCNGSMTGSNPVGQGSNPWGHALLKDRVGEPSAPKRAHRPTGRHRCRMPEIPVQVRVGPLTTIVLWPSGKGSSLTRRQSRVRVPPGLLQYKCRILQPVGARKNRRISNTECRMMKERERTECRRSTVHKAAADRKARPVRHPSFVVRYSIFTPRRLAKTVPNISTTCPRGAAWSARLPVTQEIVGSNPIGGALTTAEARRTFPCPHSLAILFEPRSARWRCEDAACMRWSTANCRLHNGENRSICRAGASNG